MALKLDLNYLKNKMRYTLLGEKGDGRPRQKEQQGQRKVRQEREHKGTTGSALILSRSADKSVDFKEKADKPLFSHAANTWQSRSLVKCRPTCCEARGDINFF